jgi:hypothetical protein
MAAMVIPHMLITVIWDTLNYIGTKFEVCIFENAKVSHREIFEHRICSQKRVGGEIRTSNIDHIIDLSFDLDFNMYLQ